MFRADSSFGRLAASITQGLSDKTLSPASTAALMRSILTLLRPDSITTLPGRSANIRANGSADVCTSSSQAVGFWLRVLKPTIRFKCPVRSEPSAAYTSTRLDTPGYISFCTNAAWK